MDAKRRLPVELVCIRHAQSIGNEAGKRARLGDLTIYTPEFRAIRSANWRLTPRGADDARRIGSLLPAVIRFPFTYYFVSPLVRTIETAGNLRLPEAKWSLESVVRERNWGPIGELPQHEALQNFGEQLRHYPGNEYRWIPPEGESIEQVCNTRVPTLLGMLYRRWSEPEPRIVICSHHTFLTALDATLEGISEEMLCRWLREEEPTRRMGNLHVIQFTRRDPINSELDDVYRWTRHFNPADRTSLESGWTTIDRPYHPPIDVPEWRPATMRSSEELIALANRHPLPPL